MGACATKSGDLKKVKGEPPLAVEDAVTSPTVADGPEKAGDGVPAAAVGDPADASRRRSLSDLLKEDVEASDGKASQEAVKVVTEESVVVADEAGAPASLSKEAEARPQVAVEPSAAVVERDTVAEQLTDDPESGQEPGGDAQAQAAEEEKRVDPDSVQVATVSAAVLSADC